MNPNVVDVTYAHEHGVEGDNVVICGGGLSGCDTAIELGENGKKVTIVEMMDEIARDVMPINKISIVRLIEEYNVNVLTGKRVVEIEKDGVVIADCEGNKETVSADAVIMAFGQRPEGVIAESILEKYPTKTTLIGDCEGVSKAAKAIREGFYAAMALQ